jgi:hypothetical protein
MRRAPNSRVFHFRAPLAIFPSRRFAARLVNTLIVIALLPFSLPAQTGAAPQAATRQAGAVRQGNVEHGVVQKVAVRETAEGTEVVIQTSGGAVSPDTQVITGPDRIVVDFPGALPSAALRTLKVNRGAIATRGALKSVRAGLFFSDPPITRIVLDLTGPQTYTILTGHDETVVKLGRAGVDEQSASAQASGTRVEDVHVGGGRLQQAALAARPGAHIAPASLAGAAPKAAMDLGPSGASLKRYSDTGQKSNGLAAVAVTAQMSALPQIGGLPQSSGSTGLVASPSATVPAEPAQPAVVVTYENGMLRIHADKATLSQVLYEVHLRTGAEIGIPAGAEQERVVADLGPAPARDVLAELLNGSAYNFIFVGDVLSLERVILTPRAGNF